jgi:hypothetical protein
MRDVKKPLASVVIALGLAGTSAAAGVNRPSLCAANEKAVFTCTVGRKTASLCASPDLTPATGYLYYAYGRPGAVELTTPDKSPAARRSITLGGLSYSGGGGDYVRIVRGLYAYVVYSAIGRGWEQEGVAVEKDGKPISSLICSDTALGPDGWQAVYGAKLARDTSNFEKPDP